MNNNFKKILIFCVTFFVISILITFSMIYLKKNDISILDYFSINKNNEDINQNVDTEDKKDKNEIEEKVLDLDGYYDQNDLLIDEAIMIIREIEVKYPQIKGLKDKEVEAMINNDIRERIEDAYNEYDIERSLYYSVYGNFANTISIYGYADYYDDTPEANYCDVVFDFNYNLISGERLKLEDLFKKDTPIIDIARKAFYPALHEARYVWYEDGTHDLASTVDENRFYREVNEYMESDERKFVFSPEGVTLFYNYPLPVVKFVDMAENVTIYDKYLTEESIFEREDIGYKKLFNGAALELGYVDEIKFGFDDNIWFETIVRPHDYEEDITEEQKVAFEKFKSEKVDELKKEVEEHKTKFKEDDENFYIIVSEVSVFVKTYHGYIDGIRKTVSLNTAGVIKGITTYKFSKELYEKIYRDKIVDTYRNSWYGSLMPNIEEDEGVTVERMYENVMFNYKTGKEFKTLEDIFTDVDAGIELLKEQMREDFMYSDKTYTSEEIENFINNASYTLNSYGIDAYIKEAEDFYSGMNYEEIPIHLSKIFE